VLNYGTSARASFAVVETGSNAKITIRNVSSKAIRIWIDLEGYYTDQNPSVAPAQFAPTIALQIPPVGTAPGAVEYSYVDNVGRLLVGYQPTPDNFSATTWTAISTIGDLFSGQPSLTARPDNLIQATAEYANTGVRVKTQTEGATPTWGSSFTDVGGSVASPPTVATLPDGSLVAFAVDSGGVLRVRPQSGSSQYWQNAGSVNLVGTPTVVTSADGVQVFGTTTSGTIKTADYSAGVMSAWTDLGGSGITSRPAVTVRPGLLYQVVVRQGDGSLATKAQGFDGSFPTDWSPVGTDPFVAQGAPATVFDPVTGQIEIIARSAADSNIYVASETVQGSQQWGGWVNASGMVSATDPTVSTFTGGNNGTAGLLIPFRAPDNSTHVATRDYSNGALARPGSLQGSREPGLFGTHQLPAPPA
jgi:hypothetical protein